MKLSNKTYDILKYVALVVLPALASLYFGLSKIWGFSYGEEIVGTISVIDTFLGALLKISTDTYWDEQKDLRGSDLTEEDGGKG